MTDTTKVIVATYTGSSRFRVPMGLDLDALMKSGDLYIRWDKLYIQINDEWITIKPHIDASEDTIDWKDGAEVTVEDYDEYCDKKEDDEEEEGEEEDNN